MRTLETLEATLRGRKPSEKTFWPTKIATDHKFHYNQETVKNYADRIIDASPRSVCADNLMFFAEIDYDGNSEIKSASCTAVVSTKKKIFDDSTENMHYFRLDFDDANLGKLFTHTVPHLHMTSDEEFRMPYAKSSQSPIFDFFESYILQFAFDQWESWAAYAIFEDEENKMNFSTEYAKNKITEIALKWNSGFIAMDETYEKLRCYIKKLRRRKQQFHPKFALTCKTKSKAINYLN